MTDPTNSKEEKKSKERRRSSGGRTREDAPDSPETIKRLVFLWSREMEERIEERECHKKVASISLTHICRVFLKSVFIMIR